MAIGTKERTELREELVNQGYSWEYIDEWQPKTTLYRHREMLSPDGAVVSPAGTALRNMPGNPDYVNKKAMVGLFTWPPSETCTCRWCNERNSQTPQQEPEQEAEEPTFSGTAAEVLSQMGQAKKSRRRMGPHFQSDS
jgi:hypothetical protein